MQVQNPGRARLRCEARAGQGKTYDVLLLSTEMSWWLPPTICAIMWLAVTSAIAKIGSEWHQTNWIKSLSFPAASVTLAPKLSDKMFPPKLFFKVHSFGAKNRLRPGRLIEQSKCKQEAHFSASPSPRKLKKNHCRRRFHRLSSLHNEIESHAAGGAHSCRGQLWI